MRVYIFSVISKINRCRRTEWTKTARGEDRGMTRIINSENITVIYNLHLLLFVETI